MSILMKELATLVIQNSLSELTFVVESYINVARIFGYQHQQEKGKEIWIFKRQADNSWKCSHIIWNTDTPPPISAEKT